MTFIAKALLGVAAVVIPSSIGVTVTYKDSLFGNSSNGKVVAPEPASPSLKNECYVIPTGESNNKKLLICKSQDELGSGSYDDYFLYNKDGKEERTKVTAINKKDSELVITLKDNEPHAKVTLAIKGGDWTEITEELELNDVCHFVDFGAGKGTKWQCINGSSDKEIELTPF